MSTLDFRDLPEDRLATTDSEGNRLWIIPALVKGKWKNRKTSFHWVLLALFVLTPWLRYKGSPLLLFDIFERQFVFFGKVFAAHDAPLLFFVLGILGFGLIIATALWGRVWCGWACPQTVFIEQVYRRIERWTVGNRAAQLDAIKNPFLFKNLRRTTMKWVVFTLVSIFLAHTFIAYFVSWEKLLAMMTRPPGESWTVFLFVFCFTAMILFDFAWFREQFCIIMCPYGRFQSVLMDQSSMTVAYDYNRGEPRQRNIKEKEATGAGDCIDCFKCVSVCPTGIDIRRGTQMECIACTACIDACDEVMTKIKRPQGLIRYSSLAELEKKPKKSKSPRLLGYFAVMVFLFAGLAWSLNQHNSFYYAILRQNQRPYVVSEDGILLNNFRMHLKNPDLKPIEYEVRLISENVVMAPETLKGELLANQDVHRPFFIQVEGWKEMKSKKFSLEISYGTGASKTLKIEDVQLVIPN